MFDYPTIARVKEYEFYKLKEMYATILEDDGNACYDKKFTMQPTGYSLG